VFALGSNVPCLIFGKYGFFGLLVSYLGDGFEDSLSMCFLALLVTCLGMGHGKSIATFDPPTPPLHLPLRLVGNVSRLEAMAWEGLHFWDAAGPTDTLCV